MSAAATPEWEPIDYNRGLIKRRSPHNENAPYVIMFVDEPGTYYYDNGKPCEDDAVARGAGYDVPRDRLEGKRRMALQEAEARINASFENAKSDIYSDDFRESANEPDEVVIETEVEGKSVEVAIEGALAENVTKEWIPSDPQERDRKRIWIDEPGRITSYKKGTKDPRETEHWLMSHLGRGRWNMIEKATGLVRFEKLTTLQAELMLRRMPVKLFGD